MSLILDALRKADHDRKIEHEPASLDGLYHDETNPSRSYNSPRNIVLAIFILVAIMVGIFVITPLLKKPEAKSEDRPGFPSVEQKQVISPSETSTKPPTVKNSVEIPQPKRVNASELSGTQVQKHYERANANQKVSTDTQKRITELYAGKTSEKNAEQDVAVLVPKPLKPQEQPQNALDQNSLVSHQHIPLIKELLPSEQKAIPTMMYTEHHYNKGTRNSIVINGKRLYEGSTPSQGIRIQRILKDGIILKQNQKEFKMPAMNSWINF